jgi:hypothetical protein
MWGFHRAQRVAHPPMKSPNILIIISHTNDLKYPKIGIPFKLPNTPKKGLFAKIPQIRDSHCPNYPPPA